MFASFCRLVYIVKIRQKRQETQMRKAEEKKREREDAIRQYVSSVTHSNSEQI